MEALERRGKLLAIGAIIFIVFWSQCKGVEGRNSTKMSYVCPPQFIRLGHSCYYLSDTKATWQNALFACKDMDSNLTVPARWEDRNLRNYLNKPSVDRTSRWIGGIYDYSTKEWKWGGELREMRYQSFSKMKKMAPEDLQWHCIAMIPDLLYRWSAKSCVEPREYICQTKLRKIPKSEVAEFKRRWGKRGNINEINVPGASREVYDPRSNDVPVDPLKNPKSYDLRPSNLKMYPTNQRLQRSKGVPHGRPNRLRKRGRSRPGTQRRLPRLFPGYRWNRRDPEASFTYNAKLLRSNNTNLTPQQVKTILARLAHMRDRQLNNKRQQRAGNDWLVNDEPPKQTLAQTHVRTYTVDNNISALHPKTIVEEFDMMPPPPPVVARPIRGTG